MTSTTHKIINGDSRQMSALTDSSIQLAITSPPYWQLKDYGTAEQIGYHDTYESYINHLNLVWQECHRVLENGCRLCINIGDQFARSAYYGRYKVIPIRTEIIKFCESIGFDYMGAIIWQKKTTTNTTGGASLMGSYPHPRNGVLSIDYEFILLFKKPGKPRKMDKDIKVKSAMTKEEWKEYFQGHWHFGGARQNGHIAMYPEELPHRLIKMFSFVGDTVLDPFLGSGTTALAAKKLDRNSVGFEINQEFIPFIKEKLGSGSSASDDKHIVYEHSAATTDFEEAIKELPYVFKDFHQFDKKIDPKTNTFGSVIDKKRKDDIDYYRVAKIISPTLVQLSDDRTIQLIGVTEDPAKTTEAIDFLEKKTKNQKVFLKAAEADKSKPHLTNAYLYLSNKTHINAHLIKHGFAASDTSIDHKYRKRFDKLQYEYQTSM